MKYDVIIVGGGLAGLTTSIYLSKKGFSVLVLERNRYPHHKVCGEYVSNEVRPFLTHLGLDIDALGAVTIDNFSISNQNGKKLNTKLPLGGFGISRYRLDQALFLLAKGSGVDFTFETVSSVVYGNGSFEVRTKDQAYHSTVTIGAYGKRAALDKHLGRSFIKGKSPWLGVKAHYESVDFPRNEVQLHCFERGYGGLSMTEKGTVNFCYLAHYQNFQKEKNIDSFNKNVVSKNPFLRTFLRNATPIFKSPLSIAQVSFEKKELVHDHMLMCGDSAGLIHPLCGNGMAMAIHSALIASQCVFRFLSERNYPRQRLEQEYKKEWKSNFNSRLYAGRKIQYLITNPKVMNTMFSFFPKSETLLSGIIKRTHGKPILA